MKAIGWIAALILIFFGVLFVWGAFGSTPRPEWIAVGVVSVAIGFGIIWLVSRRTGSSPASAGGQTVLKVDLPASTAIEAMKCRNCGGNLTAENVTLLAGALTVQCPFCGTTYQLTEEPKW